MKDLAFKDIPTIELLEVLDEQHAIITAALKEIAILTAELKGRG